MYLIQKSPHSLITHQILQNHRYKLTLLYTLLMKVSVVCQNSVSQFWDSFNAAVNNNPSLSKVQKFSYLRVQLQGDAARTIDGFPLTDNNYDQSILLLKERFGQSHKLINAHMQALLNLPPPVNSLPSLRTFIDSVETHIRALSALRVSQESYGTLLAPIIIGKLHAETWHGTTHQLNGWLMTSRLLC